MRLRNFNPHLIELRDNKRSRAKAPAKSNREAAMEKLDSISEKRVMADDLLRYVNEEMNLYVGLTGVVAMIVILLSVL